MHSPIPCAGCVRGAKSSRSGASRLGRPLCAVGDAFVVASATRPLNCLCELLSLYFLATLWSGARFGDPAEQVFPKIGRGRRRVIRLVHSAMVLASGLTDCRLIGARLLQFRPYRRLSTIPSASPLLQVGTRRFADALALPIFIVVFAAFVLVAPMTVVAAGGGFAMTPVSARAAVSLRLTQRHRLDAEC